MKTVIITGASRGIGSAAAIAFAKQGYSIVLNYNNSKEKALALAKTIRDSYSVDVLAVKADVASSAQVNEMTEKALEQFGSIDILVNNAGIAQQKLFTDITDEDWRRMLDINLTGVFNCCRSVLPVMIRNHSGAIVNISSMWGQTGGSCEVHYSAAKAGIIGLTKALAKEVGPSGIRVNCVAPGVVMTDMMNGFDDETVKELKEDTPLNTLGTPKNIADAIAFLCSDKASFITGQVLSVNGGMVI
ncbi:MAG: elongation factor P 5-aminopentanone reductase [Acutalibacteraceae bacterium]